jgi:hypothetical protein
MNFSLLLCSAIISISSARVMRTGYKMDYNTKHAYNYCEGLIEFENAGYELTETMHIFLYRCTRKFGLERSGVDFRTMMFTRENPGKVYQWYTG